MARILRVCWSTNRAEFLLPTLSSHAKNVSFEGHFVEHLFIDDYPLGRYDWAIRDLAEKYGFTAIVLHLENLGITQNWTNLWRWISEQDRFDYVWHHEDDVVFQQPVDINNLVSLLEKEHDLCQVNLKRNPWYSDEFDQPLLSSEDEQHYQYLFNRSYKYFWTMSSLYPAHYCKEVDLIIKEYDSNLGEGVVMDYMKKAHNKHMAILKNSDGTPIVKHIGVYSQGKRVLPNEPGWDKFHMYDPSKKYNSATGRIFE